MVYGLLEQGAALALLMGTVAVAGYYLGKYGERRIGFELGIPDRCEFPGEINGEGICGGLDGGDLMNIRFLNGGRGRMVMKWPTESRFYILIRKVGENRRDYRFVFGSENVGEEKYEQNIRRIEEDGRVIDLIVLDNGRKPEYGIGERGGLLGLERIV